MKNAELHRATSSSSYRLMAGSLLPLSLLASAGACSGIEERSEDTPEPLALVEQAATKGGEKGGDEGGPGTLLTGDFQHRARIAGARSLSGDYNGDNLTDLLILPGWYSPNNTQIWVGFSQGGGNIALTKVASSIATLNYYQPPGFPLHHMVSGDFNGDNKDDLASIGWYDYYPAPGPGYAIGFTDGWGGFNNTAPYGGLSYSFLQWATTSGARLLACDINGDGKDDLVTTGGNASWTTIPVAFSNGDGTFNVTNQTVASFPTWTEDTSAKVACDDFNGDGKDDLVVTGGAGWYTLPVAFSNGDGTFNVTNTAPFGFPAWSREPGAQLVTGQFNSDN